MVWVVIERCVHLTTLVLLILMISIIFNNNKTGEERSTFSLQLEEFKIENQKVRAKNIAYLEDKTNKVAETQDRYQVTTSNKLYVLEADVERLKQQMKIAPKIINNNNSNAVINMNPPEQK